MQPRSDAGKAGLASQQLVDCIFHLLRRKCWPAAVSVTCARFLFLGVLLASSLEKGRQIKR